MYDRNSLDFRSMPVHLKDSVLDIYDHKVTLGHNFVSEGKAGNTNGAIDLEGLDCFANSEGLNCIPSGRSFRYLKSRLDRSLSS